MNLVDSVLEQIERDVLDGDYTSIEELLYKIEKIDRSLLEGFLPEGDDDHDGQPDEAQEWYDFDPDA